ncbi:MAG: hypothetical protein ACLQVI_00735 [Polyangiaceae bacterium]
MPLSNRLSALALLLLTSPLACSGHSPASGTELPPACNAFVAKYESCIKASVPSLPAVAKQRAAQTRAALEKEVEGTGMAGGPIRESLSALATKCQDNVQRLAASCGSSRTN